MSATDNQIPDEIMLAAEEIVNYGPVEGRPVLRALIAQALLAERRSNGREIKRLRTALMKLSEDSPIMVNGNMQGQSDVRMGYAASVLGGGKP